MGKTIYIIRHGQTVPNVEKRFSAPEDELTDLGRQQAEFVAKRLQAFPIEAIIASPFRRASETGAIIHEILDVPLHKDDRLAEVRFPSSVVGQAKNEATNRVMSQIRDEIHPLDWHYEDGESWQDAYRRINSFLQDLLKRPEEHILIVSHGSLIQALARVLMLGDLLTAEITQRSELFFRTANTGLSICDYIEGGWRIRVWNEHIHLEN
jgi:broad specificity phosphatase PhoE